MYSIDILYITTKDIENQNLEESQIKRYIKKFFKFPPPPTDPPDIFDLLERGMLISG